MPRTPVRSLLAAALLVTGTTAAFAGGPSAETAVELRQVPFADWLAAQTTVIVGFEGRANSKPFSALGNIGYVDYAGKLAAASGLSYGLATNGTISVRKQSDGTGSVLVNVSFSNALTFALDKANDLIFGYTPDELQAAGGTATPGLSSGSLQLKYTVADADNAELNMANILFEQGFGTATQLQFHSAGRGPCRAGLGVPDGTPGVCILANTGLFNTNGGGALADAFPAEHVDVRPLGQSATTESYTSESGFDPESGGAQAMPRITTSWARVKALYR